MADKIRIGIIGAGGIFRARHLPGLAKIPDADVVAICNRSEESGRKIAEEFGLDPDILTDPHALIAREDIHAVMIGTWPYRHCPFVLESLDAGKHTFVQARMAMDLRQAKAMYARAQETGLATQICPSPVALVGDRFVQRLIRDGYLGQIYNIYVRSHGDGNWDPNRPLHWRDIGRYSGLNAMNMGIVVETLHRWFGHARTVSAHAETFVKQRPLPGGDGVGPVDRPDTVNILCEMENGAQAAFLFTGVARLAADSHGLGPRIEAYGSEGTLIYRISDDTLLGGKAADSELSEIPIPTDEAREWTVEQDFVDAIRTGKPAETTFYQGVKYMEFTEAVFRSVESGGQVRLPLVD